MTYESKLNGLQKKVFVSEKGGSMKLNNYKEIFHVKTTIGNYSYVVTVYKSSGNIDHKTSYVIYYEPLGKSNLIDPNIMVQINPITVSLGWFGTITVGHQYNLYVTYQSSNALLQYQNLTKTLNGVYTDYSDTYALLGIVLTAAIAVGSADLGLAVALAYFVASYYVIEPSKRQDINNLNSAFNSTYFNNGKGCLEIGYAETKMVYGTMNSFKVFAWDKSSSSWLTIVPSIPELLSGFAGTLKSFANEYGYNNWVLVAQNPST